MSKTLPSTRRKETRASRLRNICRYHFHNLMYEWVVVKPQGYFGCSVILKDKFLTMILFNKSGLAPTRLEREKDHGSWVPPWSPSPWYFVAQHDLASWSKWHLDSRDPGTAFSIPSTGSSLFPAVWPRSSCLTRDSLSPFCHLQQECAIHFPGFIKLSVCCAPDRSGCQEYVMMNRTVWLVLGHGLCMLKGGARQNQQIILDGKMQWGKKWPVGEDYLFR